MKIKKIMLILTVNLLLFINLFFVINWILAIKEGFYKTTRTNIYFSNKGINLPYSKNKKSITLTGHYDGFWLQDRNSLQYKIQKYTKRQVNYLEVFDVGLQNILCLIETESEDYNLKNDEYFMIGVHPNFVDNLYRYKPYQHAYFEKTYDLYELKDNKLVRKDEKVRFSDYLKSTFVVQALNEQRIKMIPVSKKLSLMEIYFKRMKEVLQEKSPNTKLVIFISYCPYSKDKEIQEWNKTWQDIEKAGIIVLRFDEEGYNFYDDNGQFNLGIWDKIIPEISKRLKL